MYILGVERDRRFHEGIDGLKNLETLCSSFIPLSILLLLALSPSLYFSLSPYISFWWRILTYTYITIYQVNKVIIKESHNLQRSWYVGVKKVEIVRKIEYHRSLIISHECLLIFGFQIPCSLFHSDRTIRLTTQTNRLQTVISQFIPFHYTHPHQRTARRTFINSQWHDGCCWGSQVAKIVVGFRILIILANEWSR